MRGHTISMGKMIAVLMAVMLMFSPAYAAPKAWQISETNGEVSIETGNGVRAASRGLALKAGDAVKTGVSGRAVIVRGGEYVIVSPKSRVRITRPEETGAITQIFQSVGSALFKIEKKETPHFGVKTPYLAAVVKGTTFTITVTESGATLQVTEGRVEVSTLDGGATDMIVPGRIGRVDANDRQLLKVLGTDEKSIRSPLPAPTGGSVGTGQGQRSAADASSSQDGNDRQLTGSSSDSTGNDISNSASDEAGSGYSGRINAQINSEPVSLAMVTGGLISSNQAIDRIAGRNENSSPAGGNANSGSSNGAGSNADGNDSGNDGGNSGSDSGNSGANGNSGGNAGSNGNSGGNGSGDDGSSGSSGGNTGSNGNSGGNASGDDGSSGNGGGNAGGNGNSGGNGSDDDSGSGNGGGKPRGGPPKN